MKFYLNGKLIEKKDEITIKQLMEENKLPKNTLIYMNQSILTEDELNTIIQNKDIIDFLRFTGGG